MSFFQSLALLIVITTLGGYLNHMRIRLPATIGLTAIALASSIILVTLGASGIVRVQQFEQLLPRFDFSDLVFHGFLPFLLFAGSLQVDVKTLGTVKWTVATLATLATLISTFLVGLLFWLVASWFGTGISLPYALLFGALISPTDPIAVLGIIKKVGAPADLEARITGESLFNDGVGAVIFFAMLSAVGGNDPSAVGVGLFFLRQAFGGVAIGLLLGWLVYRMARTVDDHHMEVLLSLALCMGSYALADSLGMSGPLAVVIAGLFLGNRGFGFAFSETTRRYLGVFWEVIDEILNSVLFLLIGFEMIAVKPSFADLALGAAGVLCVLIGRGISVAIPILALGLRFPLPSGTIVLLTWGGLRGALSIALALLLPAGPEKDSILAVTYVVVIFSVLVQGTTFGHVLKKVMPRVAKAGE